VLGCVDPRTGCERYPSKARLRRTPASPTPIHVLMAI